MLGAIFFDLFAFTLIGGAMALSLADGRSYFKGSWKVSRAEKPVAFWTAMAFQAGFLLLVLAMTLPTILAGL